MRMLSLACMDRVLIEMGCTIILGRVSLYLAFPCLLCAEKGESCER